jgi:hypothetical protein
MSDHVRPLEIIEKHGRLSTPDGILEALEMQDMLGVAVVIHNTDNQEVEFIRTKQVLERVVKSPWPLPRLWAVIHTRHTRELLAANLAEMPTAGAK